MKKRILSLTLALAMIMAFVPNMIYAEELRYGDLTYHKYDDHIEITHCDTKAVSVDIPAEIDGLPVTSIGNSAFSWRGYLTSVTIPNSVTSIGDSAFESCHSLTSVTIGTGVTSIGNWAFYGTAYYNDGSNWQNGVLYIDNCLIKANNDELYSNYTINSGTRVIAYCAFRGCDNLTSVTIPSSVTSICDEAFEDCTGLTSVTIPDSVTSIGGRAFADCTGLTNVTIPDSITIIDGGVFAGCTGLTNVTIPDSVTSIGYEAFYGCESLTNVTIPGSVTSIGSWPFSCCGSLNITVDENNPNYSDIDGVLVNKDKTEIIVYAKDKIQPEYSIPSGVTSIGEIAFWMCSSLTSVTIPGSVTSIGAEAFAHCRGLTSVTISNGVTSIGWDAFWMCSSLTSITIPSSVTSIGVEAFEFCDSLTDVYYTGSEEQWQNIIMGYGNYSLTGATIYYNSESLPRIEVPKPVVEGGSITISAKTKNIEDEGELFAVGYDGNKLTASEKLQGGAATLPAEDVQTIKVFCWDSLDTMRPLCEPKTITIK